MTAEAYWTVGPEQGEIRQAPLAPPGPEEVLVRALSSAISRGTETLVHRHAVPEAVRPLMRAPFQEGDLPGPVKYGYLSVGVVEEGPGELVGRRVFCLHPHQTRYVVPASAVVPVPDDVPTGRALLAGAVETAVNALWDAAPRLGDRVAVVGLGMIGASVATLLTGFPLERLQVVDTDPARRGLADRLGLELVAPDDAAGDCDVVLHASASEAGLATALRLAGEEAEVVELSWYGTDAPRVPLGEAFHARRLTLRASQVGAVSAARRTRRTTTDRLAVALDALRDPRFDALLTGASDFAELPEVMADIASGRLPALCHVIRYPEES
ncbi:Threonine dehydrogenase [Georgenia satyanarayanai]|uniref:Threonine dehydrogenase n=1 Tax=Georgenia satyanarayanai TaxID=860221 RepID=A0A2Y9AA73_9MICO|nr:zinc-binding alcohol dehydrogenase [Georgenia satyanarayanai]PYG00129.1 threonine dehydrogenase-like Zn-dependent dehydrogenase [Georgenia satyanarayanai]SSA40198.1 Threonine dehydrogenase [Georgenia satyanarayanai]